MNKFITALALILAATTSAASAAPSESVSYEYYNSNGVMVGTRTLSCDGTDTISGQQTTDEVETDRQDCGGTASRDTDPEVKNGPPP